MDTDEKSKPVSKSAEFSISRNRNVEGLEEESMEICFPSNKRDRYLGSGGNEGSSGTCGKLLFGRPCLRFAPNTWVSSLNKTATIP